MTDRLRVMRNRKFHALVAALGIAFAVQINPICARADDSQAPVYDRGSTTRWPDEMIMSTSVPDPETWVYEHVVKDGKPAFPYVHFLIRQRPFRDFLHRKLGCMPNIGVRQNEIRPDDRGLDNDIMLNMFGAGNSPRMAVIGGRYLVGHGHLWQSTWTKGFMILDTEKRRSAFAVTVWGNYWASKNNRVVDELSGDRRVAVFMTEDSSPEFLDIALRLVHRWQTEWNIESHIQGFPHISTLPVDVYAFRCDRP